MSMGRKDKGCGTLVLLWEADDAVASAAGKNVAAAVSR
jgi:hypothetical protein